MALIEKDLADELVELRQHMADRPDMTVDAATLETALARHLACEQQWRAVIAETADSVRGLT